MVCSPFLTVVYADVIVVKTNIFGLLKISFRYKMSETEFYLFHLFYHNKVNSER